ncbi:isoleucine--tRNA ligase [Paenibacillus sp. FSL H7-0350]|uniref:isoleucine--tRNA ligase n=1 Tax=Paenibacillus sp. FSL H7-0350 TaxID=2975345 RepID=UPI0031584A19
MKYKELTARPEVAAIQKEILEFWENEKIFEQSVKGEGKGEVVFYDGPPFPTGKPHHGTVLVSFIKDMIARYWTMKGYKVPRVWGWDCHGLPIENQVEVLMGIKDKNEIEKNIGIDKFNEKCFEIVSNNNESWKEYVDQMARWVDYDGAYKTMNPEYMESVMWAFKECYNKGLIYRNYRVTPYCTHCETSLSISDTRESDSTRLRQDRWVIARFKTQEIIENKVVYLLAWTTTPWTLPSNLCLAVGVDLDYAFVDVGEAIYVASKNTLKNYSHIFGAEPIIVKECKGTDLLGIEYEPLFDYFKDTKDAFRVVSADYVGAEDGVGIVHIAPAFGEDDYWTCKKHGISLVNPVDEKGRYTAEVTDFYDPKGEKNVIEMNPVVIRFLYDNGRAIADGVLEHNYPHCWRCKHPLIYKAMDAWYFDIGKIKNRMVELNEGINWIPDTVKSGRFGNWLENARDWNISRNRYWSTPIPIWECEECGDRVVLGSIEEIYQASGIKLYDLHRQYMDTVTFDCKCCGKTMRRIPEVLDCWFESGSVPFAQKHYPFENKEWFESHFPSDFIVEYTGQIRCWFYYLHVLAVALFDKNAYQNCIVHGTILAKDGKKLSKSSKNYTDPMQLMKQYGTDAFRLYLYQTNAMLLGDLLFDESGILEAYQQLVLPFWNACNFFIAYANIDGFKPDGIKEPVTDNQLDKWILCKLYEAEVSITANMDAYQVNKYIEHLLSLIDGLTNWYIRRSRRRFWSGEMSKDKLDAYETLYYVIVNITKLFAPVAPIIAEKIYTTLTGDYSVHLKEWPRIPAIYEDKELLNKIALVQKVIYLARTIRNKNSLKNRQPLSLLKVAFSDVSNNEIIKEFSDIIAEELNVKNVEIIKDSESIAYVKYDPNFNEIRNRYPNRIPEIVKSVKNEKFEMLEDEVILEINGQHERFDSNIILVSYKAKDGFFVASDHGIVVSLDITLTPELKQEGLVRDIIRNIQDARKQIGCDITDRIVLEFSTNVLKDWHEYICRETMGSTGTVANPVTEISVEDDDNNTIEVKIQKYI